MNTHAESTQVCEEIDLSGKVVLITGGNTGIGLATAELFLSCGAICLINHISDEGLDKIASFDKSKCFTVKADISDHDQVAQMFDTIKENWGKLDILVSNAGMHLRTDTKKMPEDAWNTVLDTNLKGAFSVSQQAINLMEDTGGKIVFVSSDTALKGSTGGGAHYCASKGGLLGLSNALAKEFAGAGIYVNSVLPGLTSTGLPNISKEAFEEREKSIPLGRAAEPHDIAKAILFFASPMSDYVTGQSLVVNGGQPVR